MNYEIGFWVLIAVIVTYILSNVKLYIGRDRDKYEAANIGILLK